MLVIAYYIDAKDNSAITMQEFTKGMEKLKY